MTASDDPSPLPSGKLKQRVIPDPPEMDQAQGRRAFAFVLVLVLVAALVMAGVLALNVVADPYGSVGTHFFPTVTTSDRTVKADKIEQLKQPPDLVVLGSSRSMRYEPAYLEEKTGLKTFNAGVNGIGGTADAWAMTQFIHEVWPDSHPAYLWLVDVESFVPFEVGARTANEPRLAQYVGQASIGKGPRQFARALWENRSTLFSLDTAKESLRLLLTARRPRAARASTASRSSTTACSSSASGASESGSAASPTPSSGTASCTRTSTRRWTPSPRSTSRRRSPS